MPPSALTSSAHICWACTMLLPRVAYGPVRSVRAASLIVSALTPGPVRTPSAASPPPLPPSALELHPVAASSRARVPARTVPVVRRRLRRVSGGGFTGGAPLGGRARATSGEEG